MSAEWIRRESLSADDPSVPAALEQQRSAALDVIRDATSFVVIARKQGGQVHICQAINTADSKRMLAGLTLYVEAGGSLFGLPLDEDEDEDEGEAA